MARKNKEKAILIKMTQLMAFAMCVLNPKRNYSETLEEFRGLAIDLLKED